MHIPVSASNVPVKEGGFQKEDKSMKCYYFGAVLKQGDLQCDH